MFGIKLLNKYKKFNKSIKAKRKSGGSLDFVVASLCTFGGPDDRRTVVLLGGALSHTKGESVSKTIHI